MSTRCIIAIKRPHQIDSIWCKDDGYPEGEHSVGQKLLDHYTDEMKICRLISLGDIESLEPTVDEVIPFSGGDTTFTTYKDLGRHLRGGSDYFYLFSGRSQSWSYSKIVDDKFEEFKVLDKEKTFAITQTLREIITERTGNAARGRRGPDASAEECIEADRIEWARHARILEVIGDLADEEITIEYSVGYDKKNKSNSKSIFSARHEKSLFLKVEVNREFSDSDIGKRVLFNYDTRKFQINDDSFHIGYTVIGYHSPCLATVDFTPLNDLLPEDREIKDNKSLYEFLDYVKLKADKENEV